MHSMCCWPGLVCLTFASFLVLSCAGDVETDNDGGPIIVDTGTAPDTTDDTINLDSPAAPDVLSADTQSTSDLSPMGQCAQWASWTCDEDHPSLLCQATCQSGGASYQLGCVSSGDCVCGVAMAPCGTYSWTSPCDACQKAVEDSCCLR